MSSFSQKRTCKNCVFSELTSCRFGVKVRNGVLEANSPLEPCHKITSDRGERDFYLLGMDKVFRADLEIYRVTV